MLTLCSQLELSLFYTHQVKRSHVAVDLESGAYMVQGDGRTADGHIKFYLIRPEQKRKLIKADSVESAVRIANGNK